MDKEEKIEILKSLSPEELLDALTYYETHFNPLNDDTCESYSLTKQEIMRRLKRDWEARK